MLISTLMNAGYESIELNRELKRLMNQKVYVF